ncbi:MAG: addiction module toxin, HicA family [Gammaproteobacteria bacterium]|nr:addiction module toxin, HicA family [Gammaproteobacteria bacterium]MBT4495002.1 addiction module toxin, HicA family [Gammaproteobacteria bacterium]
MKSKDLIKELEANGWKLKRIRGSHHQFIHPDFGHSVTVPHPKKDLGKGLVNAIRKQARLK